MREELNNGVHRNQVGNHDSNVSVTSGLTGCTPRLTPSEVKRFQSIIYAYYRQRGRHLPWRETCNPYHILVSEIMLQQTQAERVVQKYREFLQSFPTILTLAEAPLRKVLGVWQGLGYNRRALALRKTAQILMRCFDGEVPSEIQSLVELPGIGPPTASAIVTFAYDTPAVFVETNIRAVFIYFFFPNGQSVPDKEILPFVDVTLDRSDPRTWYYALMDYGVGIKRDHPELSQRSAHYRRQSPFHGSNRQIRGAILRVLVTESSLSFSELTQRLKLQPQRAIRILSQLEQEELLKKQGQNFTITC